MKLSEKINEAIKIAMKAQEKEKLLALRAVKSELLLKQTSGSSEEITDEEEIKILQKLVKQRKDAAEMYKSQDRIDLFDNEMKELAYIQEYLPKQLSDDDLTKIIQEIIAENGATSIKEMGKIIGLANKKLAGQAEGKVISEKVKQLLS